MSSEAWAIVKNCGTANYVRVPFRKPNRKAACGRRQGKDRPDERATEWRLGQPVAFPERNGFPNGLQRGIQDPLTFWNEGKAKRRNRRGGATRLPGQMPELWFLFSLRCSSWICGERWRYLGKSNRRYNPDSVYRDIALRCCLRWMFQSSSIASVCKPRQLVPAYPLWPCLRCRP